MRLLVGLVALALVIPARASDVIPADANAGRIPNITVWNESDAQTPLWELLRASGSGPVFVLPVYTHCTMSCPVLASRLARETSQLAPGVSYRVLIFSFDPADDAASLRQFRMQEKLPSSWLIVRASDLDIRRFTDFFHYRIVTEGPVMLHTNQIFLLDHSLTWRATFVNESWSVADLRTWLKRVEAPGIIGWLVMNPATLAFVGLGGMVVSLALILWALIARAGQPAQSDPSRA